MLPQAAKLQEGRTDDQGVYRFPVPAEGKAHGLRIVVKAGEGHQNEWMMDAAELAAVQTPAIPASASEAKDAAAPAAEKTSPVTHAVSTATPGAKDAAAPTPSAAGVSSGELQTIVNAALDVKLGPHPPGTCRNARVAPRIFLKFSAASAGWWVWRVLPFTSRGVRG